MQTDKNKEISFLKQYFGYDTFRPLQQEIIQTLLQKQDALVLMPTGGGKSICFQIPALMQPGFGIVISPLIALMKDQVEGLVANGVPAAFLNSSISSNKQTEILQKAGNGDLKLLYVSPERFLTEDFYYFIKKQNISLFAIDEAHCISQWGHDFRPEYTRLSFIKKHFKQTPVIALTATADKITRNDIIKQLEIPKSQIFISSFDRPNLSITVLPGRKRIEYILDFVAKRGKQPGIIYCLSRKTTEEVAMKLQANSYVAEAYHAGLSSQERSKIQEDFINDNIPIICATIAFGMGIDKSNIRWIIHYNLPKSLESYYQEIGRAGRDGLRSDTVLFYSYGDVMRLQRFVEESGQREIQAAKLDRMKQFAESFICRRKMLLSYFGENYAKNCNNCDVCKNPPEQFDGTVLAQKALSAVYRLKEKVAAGMLIDILRGSLNQKIQQNNYHRIKTYKAGADTKYADWQRYIMQMVNMGLLEIAYDKGNALTLTEASSDVLFNRHKVSLVKIEEEKKRVQTQAEYQKPVSKTERLKNKLFERLRILRKTLADKQNIAPYLVFNDATLEEIAQKRPVTKQEMLDVSGVGRQKLESYSQLFINEIIDFIATEQEALDTMRGSTYIVTYDKLKKGKTIEQIAEERKLKPTTIYSHFAYLYEKGAPEIEITDYVDKTELKCIVEEIDKNGIPEKLKDMYTNLDEKIDYYKLRLGISYYKKNKAFISS